MNDTFDSPLEGVYPFTSTDPEEAVLLHEGPMEVIGLRSSAIGTGRVLVRVVDGLDLRWEFDGNVPWDEPVRLKFDRPDGSSVEVPAAVTNSAGSGYIESAEIRPTGPVAPSTANQPAGLTPSDAGSVVPGDESELAYVLTHWFNMPSFLPSSPLAVANTVFAGRWDLEAEGWRLTLDQRPDHNEAMKRAKHTTRSTMTHVAKLERQDGSSFSVADATDVLAGLEAAVSFAVGAWVGVALPVGYDQSGYRVWEEWASWRCSPPAGVFRWWSTHRSQDLTELCTSFLRHWHDPKRKDCVRLASFHSVSASSDRATLEAKVMVAQAGIEYLAWVTNVLEGAQTAKVYHPIPAEEKFRDFLQSSGIPTAIPSEFGALRALVPQVKQSGPQACTWVRNRLVHPKDASEPYRIENALAESWLLSREYLDLLILRRLGYEGHHVPYRPGGWAHNTQSVPWCSVTATA